MGGTAGSVEVEGCEGTGSEAWTEVSGAEVSARVCCGTSLARLGSGAESGTTTSATRLATKP